MNILFVSIAAPPVVTGAECLQVGKFLKHLAAKNPLTLITVSVPGKNHWQQKDQSQNSLLKDVDQIIKLTTISTLGKYSGLIPRKLFKNQFTKPDTDFLFHRQSKSAVNRLKSVPDVIYSRSAPFSSAVMGLKIKKLLNKPWVMHLSDPWVDSTFNEKNEYSVEMESECFKLADKISFTTPETESFYKNKYPQYIPKYFVCPNVYEKSEISDDIEIFTGEKIKLLFSGHIYGRRSIAPMIESLKLLDKEKTKLLDIGFVGNVDENNLEILASSGLKCVTYDGFVNPSESYARQRESDILISLDQPVKNEVDKVYMPSKIQDYMAARKFILAITANDSATHNAIDQKYGLCFEHSDLQGLLKFWNELIDAFINKRYEFLKLAPLNERFEAVANAEKLQSVFENLVSNRS